MMTISLYLYSEHTSSLKFGNKCSVSCGFGSCCVLGKMENNPVVFAAAAPKSISALL